MKCDEIIDGCLSCSDHDICDECDEFFVMRSDHTSCDLIFLGPLCDYSIPPVYDENNDV